MPPAPAAVAARRRDVTAPRAGRGGAPQVARAVACTVRSGPAEAIEDDTLVLELRRELRLGNLGKPAVVRALRRRPGGPGGGADIRNQWMRRREAVPS